MEPRSRVVFSGNVEDHYYNLKRSELFIYNKKYVVSYKKVHPT